MDCGICFCRSSHARPIHSPTLCWSNGGSFTGAVCTAPVTLLASNKKEGWEGGTTGGPIVVQMQRRSVTCRHPYHLCCRHHVTFAKCSEYHSVKAQTGPTLPAQSGSGCGLVVGELRLYAVHVRGKPSCALYRGGVPLSRPTSAWTLFSSRCWIHGLARAFRPVFGGCEITNSILEKEEWFAIREVARLE